MTELAQRPVAVFADESCLGNGREGSNPGGAAGLIQWFVEGTPDPVQRDYWLSEPATTNNRMALRSAIEAFRLLSVGERPDAVYFTSDSKYLVEGMTRWAFDWVRRGWRRKGGTLENLALWQELLDVASRYDHRWRWVRGHDAHPQNEYAHYLATRAARTQDASDGAVQSGFDAWLLAERGRRRITRDPDAAPVPAEFRVGCTAPPSLGLWAR